ncbi:hypothetical protein GCK72_005207 [Caenorhabditis remanei]|uniref:Uncharacterized protein n=1 Tax=Caenorhabditis remanei TaxID=31234 RepID=A0A6A5HD78_CAERE|nr:hypothetical protein GCK72_005207 [Caenorhabditis remanei]KAF1765255.1 hypothetical protein GCK72_005207 [Caenorhabditis remanei]
MNTLSHIFHLGWLVKILWYPMWISAYIVKVFSEMYIIVISLFSISRYFVYYSLAKPSVELTQNCVKAGIRVISGLMIFKDLVLFNWLIVVLEIKEYKEMERILGYYYGIHLTYQLLLFLAAFLQIPILCSTSKAEIEPSRPEKLIYFQTVLIAFSKLILIPTLLFLLYKGINHSVLSAIFVSVDLLLVPIAVQISEICNRPTAVRSAELQMGPV